MAAIRQPISLADQFGVIDVVPDDPSRIRDFLEKPTDAVGLPDSPHEVLASMGNYVFDADALVQAVRDDAVLEGSAHDMGGDIVPSFVAKDEASVYDFRDNTVPGSTDRDRDYWRDVGTMSSYFAAHMDVIAPLPVFNLYNFQWPIYTTYGPQPPAKLVRAEGGTLPHAEDAVLSPGVVVTGGRVYRSVLSPAVRVEQNAEVSDSILMHDVRVGAGAIVRNAILDKNVVVPPGRPRRGRPRGGPGPRLHGRGRPDRARQGAAVPVLSPGTAPGGRPSDWHGTTTAARAGRDRAAAGRLRRRAWVHLAARRRPRTPRAHREPGGRRSPSSPGRPRAGRCRPRPCPWTPRRRWTPSSVSSSGPTWPTRWSARCPGASMPEGWVPAAAVIAVGCDIPPGVVVDDRDGFTVHAEKVNQTDAGVLRADDLGRGDRRRPARCSDAGSADCLRATGGV